MNPAASRVLPAAGFKRRRAPSTSVEFRSPTGFPTPGLTSDAVVLRGDEVLLVKRAKDPAAGRWALPGGFCDVGERTTETCLRELQEETGLKGVVLDLLGVYDDPSRDPRGHVVSIAYVVRVPADAVARAGDDAAEVAWFPLDDLPETAFDHGDILEDALDWLDAGGEALLETV